jgi:hypothetical protein
MPADAHIEQAGCDLLFPGPPLEQGTGLAAIAVEQEAVEGAMPHAGRVGIVPADPAAGLPPVAV